MDNGMPTEAAPITDAMVEIATITMALAVVAVLKPKIQECGSIM